MTKKNKKIAVIGGTGFIGKKLINKLINLKNYDLIVISRNKNQIFPKLVRFVVSDFKDLKCQKNVLQDIEIIINLVTPKENTKELANEFMKICNLSNIKKIIHMSSISIYGPQKNKIVSENTECLPSNNYAQNKILFDKTIFNYSSNYSKLIILRPTIVFGTGGQNLKNYFLNFVKENSFKSFIKKSLFYNRKMNLLSVNNLVECIIFMIKKNFSNNEIFIISEDDSKENNYLFFYSQLENLLNRKKILKPINIPLKISDWIFGLFKKDNHGLNVIFSNSKLTKIGYKNKYDFSEELKIYIFNELKSF